LFFWPFISLFWPFFYVPLWTLAVQELTSHIFFHWGFFFWLFWPFLLCVFRFFGLFIVFISLFFDPFLILCLFVNFGHPRAHLNGFWPFLMCLFWLFWPFLMYLFCFFDPFFLKKNVHLWTLVLTEFIYFFDLLDSTAISNLAYIYIFLFSQCK